MRLHLYEKAGFLLASTELIYRLSLRPLRRMRDEKLLLIGGGGYIGSVLTEVLLKARYRVRLFDRFFFGKRVLKELDQERQL